MKHSLSAMALALLSSGLISGAAQAEGLSGFVRPEFKFSGFGTVGAVQTNSDDGQYVREQQARGATKNASLLVDSNLGLQLDAKANDWLSATVQTLTAQRTEDSLSTRFEWAFVKATPLDGLSLRAGKFSLPNFLISDSRRVGYANTWLRPANEVYGLDLLNGGLKGADLSYRWSLAGHALTVTGLAGKSSATMTNASAMDVKSVKGLNVVWDGDWYTVRLGRITGKPQLPASLAVMLPAGTTLNEVYRFTGVGATVDRADVVLQAEYVQRRSEQFNSLIGADAWYLLGGYRVGKLLPYVSFAERKPDGNSATAPQKTAALGLRWDAFASAALKFQLERVDTKGTTGASFIAPTVNSVSQPMSKPVTTLSAAIDFVF